MNVDKQSILPSANLSLALGYPNHSIPRILNSDPGAGANAASRLDMTFLATNTLSELVWSPEKGLCLKCTDRKFLDQDPSLSYDLDRIDMSSESSSDKPVFDTKKPVKEIYMASLASCKLGSEVVGEGNYKIFSSSNAGIIPLGITGTCDRLEEMKNGFDLNFLQKEDLGNNEEEDEFKPDVAQKFPTCKESIAGVKDLSEGSHVFGKKTVVAPERQATKECEAYETKVQCSVSTGRGHEKMPSLIDDGRKGKMDSRNVSIIQLELMESTAENDLENPLGENAFCVATESMTLKSANMFDSNTQLDDGFRHADKTIEVKQSSNSSKLQKGHINGKAIISTDEFGDRMMLNQEDDSSETVESCNSTGKVSTRKRLWNFQQMLIVENKKFKRKMHESLGSLSKQDSLFMNWISNMTKGLWKSPEGEVPSYHDGFSNLDPRLGDADQDFITCNKKDLESRNVGFHSLFRSLYSGKRKSQEDVTFNADRETKISEEQGNRSYDMNATPITCCMPTGNVHKQLLLTSERLNNSKSGNHMGPEVNAENGSVDLAVIKESNSKSTEHRSSSNLATNKEKDGTSSNSSLGRCKTDSVEKFDSEIPNEGMTSHSFGFKGDLSDSLWVARFTRKASGPFPNLNPWKKSTGVHLDDSADDGMKLKPQLLNLISASNENETDEVGKKCSEAVPYAQNRGTDDKASFGFCKIKEAYNDSSSYKLNQMIPSSGYNRSEATASVFAQRSDALKQIVLSNDPDKADYATMTRFYCGVKGHHLRDYREIPGTELEDLLRNFNTYDVVKDGSCVCIRCFQPNHWAVACRSVCKRLRNEPECDTSLTNQCRPRKMQLDLDGRNDDNQKQESTITDALKACYYNESGMEKKFSFNLKSNEASTSQKMALDTKLFGKEIASSSGEKKLKENQTIPPYSHIDGRISDVPDGVFDAIRSLRLTRTDVLKWINSSLPVSHLDGFFLRLRLGKWEEVLGGTGYYAAYITGVQNESSLEKSKSSISINVGGMKCLVKSQYVSNHDFLEDELRGWWCATLKGGGDLIPTEEELRLKALEKRRLGLY